MARSDSGYAAIIVYGDNALVWSEAKDYISVHLKDSLIPNKLYYLEFYVSLADSSKYATSLIGAYFSKDSMAYYGSLFLPLAPHVENDTGNIIIDKINWTKIAGCYQATGGERHLTIGNFHSDTITQNFLTPLTTPLRYAFYYVDDVELYEIPAFKSDSNHFICAGVIDSTYLDLADTSQVTTYQWSPTNGLTSPNLPQTWAKPSVTTTYTLSQYTPCDTSTIDVTVFVGPNACDSISTAVEDFFNPANFKLYPNPNKGEFVFAYEIEQNAQLTIYNIAGQEIEIYELQQGSKTLRIANNDLDNGIYFYKVFIEGETKYTGKFAVVK